ncbi:MAG: hypothetical protein ACRC5T_03425 [Cetobacterium sp.]
MSSAIYMQKRRKGRREAILELSGNCCSICSSTENLEFNHVDRSTKLFVLSGKGLDKSWEKILAELDKCELLCRDCHLEKTRDQFARKELRPWNDKTDTPQIHGTVRAYTEINCRCNICKYAKKLYRSKEIGYLNVVSIPA